MKRPAVFFDRDNTLIACHDFLSNPQKVVLVNGAADAVARARQLGFVTVIFSNQSGVARGLFSEETVHAINQRIDELLRDANPKAVIDRHEFCPFHPDASIEKYRQDSPLRKPKPGMLHSAADALNLDLEQSWVIGDAPRDIEAGHAAGCRTIMFTDPHLKCSPAAQAEPVIEPDHECDTLKDAMDFIEENSDKPPAPEPEPTVAPRQDPNESTPTITKVLSQSQPHSTARLESLANEILQEIRRQREQPHTDFSVSKLMAGIVQVLVLAVLFMAFLSRGDLRALIPLLIFALTLQTMTIALLVMGRQR